MAFVSGPRQVGKTTLGLSLLEHDENYFTWDDPGFRTRWSKNPVEAVSTREAGPIMLDEIHRDRRWKARLKGLCDQRGKTLPILVAGSARLDLYRRGGESLLGRYLPYRLHPFSVSEAPFAPPAANAEVTGWTSRAPRFPVGDLLRLGGFPEPLLGGHEGRARRWSRLRLERLLVEDVRDLRAIQDLQALRVLADLLPARVGSLLSMNALREDVGVAYATVRAWLQAFEALYLIFLIRPYAGRLARTLKAEPKMYLYDLSSLPPEAEGQRRENLVALHLLKACHFWTDTAEGEFELRFVRDREKREVDFLVLREKKPWLMVECKSGALTPAKHLLYFAEALKVPHRIQLVAKPGFDRWFAEPCVRVLDYQSFLSMLV